MSLGSRVLRQAADSYDRAPYGRIPGPHASREPPAPGRLLAAYAAVSGDSTLAVVTLITRLVALAEAVAELREVQQRAAQAASARKAAERLRAARSAYGTWTPVPPRRDRMPGERVHLEFPSPVGSPPHEAAVPVAPTPAGAGSRASPRPSSTRARGPTR
jgi:hypothetical protein